MKKYKINVLVLTAAFFTGVSGWSQEKKWTIEECLNYAYEHNISIKQSQLDVEAIDVDKRSAVGAFLPSINLNAQHSWNTGLNQSVSTGLFVDQTTQFTTLGLASSVP